MATILVVDDEEQICCMLKELFELDGHSVLTARNGMEAERLMDGSIDLAIVDIIMPYKTGLDFLHGLRSQQQDVAVLLMSGGGTFKSGRINVPHEEVPESERLIEKPFTGSEIRAVVSDMLGVVNG